jgi:hypothetical protein
MQPCQQQQNIPVLQNTPTVHSQDSVMLDPSSSTLSQQQELYTLPMYSDELGRIPLHGQIKFTPPTASSSHSHQAHPSHALGGVVPLHLHQHIPNHQPGDPGGLWYSFEQAQMRGFQSFGIAPDATLMGAGLSGASGSGTTAGGTGLGGDGVGSGSGSGGVGEGGPSSQVEADYIFNQLAMGYPAAPYVPDAMHSGLSQMLNGGMGFGNGSSTMMQPRYGLGSNSGSGNHEGDEVEQQQRQDGYLDSGSMGMWSAAPNGYE